MTGHQYGCVPFMISEIAWQKKLKTDQQREAVTKAAEEAMWYMRRQVVKLGETQLKAMVAEGIIVNKVDVAVFRKAAQPVYDHFEGVFGRELVQKILAKAAEVRGK